MDAGRSCRSGSRLRVEPAHCRFARSRAIGDDGRGGAGFPLTSLPAHGVANPAPGYLSVTRPSSYSHGNSRGCVPSVMPSNCSTIMFQRSGGVAKVSESRFVERAVGFFLLSRPGTGEGRLTAFAMAKFDVFLGRNSDPSGGGTELPEQKMLSEFNTLPSGRVRRVLISGCRRRHFDRSRFPRSLDRSFSVRSVGRSGPDPRCFSPTRYYCTDVFPDTPRITGVAGSHQSPAGRRTGEEA